MAFTNGLDVDIGDPTKASDYDDLADNTEFNRETSDEDHDFAISGGTGYHRCSIDNPMHIIVETGGPTVWTGGWWLGSDTRWYWLFNTADVASFSRADAEFYIQARPISEVPAS